jgi:hypothetical protein
MSTGTCEGCSKPIADGQASITENTPTTSQRWHLRCWPRLPRAVEFVREAAEPEKTP